MAVVHCYPVGDLVAHDIEHGDDCPCGPAVELVPNDDGPDGWLITHHSLDGRERFES